MKKFDEDIGNVGELWRYRGTTWKLLGKVYTEEEYNDLVLRQGRKPAVRSDPYYGDGRWVAECIADDYYLGEISQITLGVCDPEIWELAEDPFDTWVKQTRREAGLEA